MMSSTARLHAIAGFVIMLLLCGIANWPGTPVFSAEPSASALTYDESTMYAAGVRRFAEHGGPAWELDVVELSGQRFSYAILHQIVLGVPALLCGDVEAVWRAAHVLLPACAWLLFFLLVNDARRSPALASAAAWVATVIAAGPRNSLLMGADAFIQPMEFTRTPQPALSTLLLLLALRGLCRVLTRERTKWIWITGPLFGALFYAYYFHAVAAWALLGAVLIVELIQRGAAWRKLLWIVASGMAVALPYVIWTVDSMHSGVTRELMARIGEFTRKPSWLALAGLVMFAIWFFWCDRKKKNELQMQRWLLCGLIAGGFLVANLHLITGYNAQHEHAWNRIIQPFGVILAACVLPWSGASMNLVSVVIISVAGLRQVKVAEHQRMLRGPDAVLEKLQGCDTNDLVVGTMDEAVRCLLPTLTRHWSFVPVGFRTLASNEEILTRFVIIARLAGMEHDEALKLLKSPPPAGAMRTYCYGLLDDFDIQPVDVERFETIWVKTGKPGDLLQHLAARRLDVLLLPQDKEPARIEGVTLSPLFETGTWRAFRVRISAPPPAR